LKYLPANNKQPEVWVFPPTGAEPITKEIFEKAIPPEKQPLGLYSIRPGFSLTKNYDLTEYDVLTNKIIFGENGFVQEVEKCEKTGNPLQVCVSATVDVINKKIFEPLKIKQEVNFELVDGPCNNEENIKSDFLEYYAACSESSDTNCICAIPLKQAAQNDASPVTIELLPDETKQSLPRPRQGIDQSLAEIPAKIIRQSSANPQITQEKITISINEHEREKTIYFYKSADGLSYLNENPAQTQPICKISKRTFKVCARRLDREYTVFDENTGITAARPIEYKFALTFPDRTAPLPVTAEVFPEPIGEGSLIMKWKKNEAIDIMRYDIFFAPSEGEL